MTRTAYADQLAGQWLEAQRREQPQVLLRPGEADVVVRLVREVAAAYPDEPMAALADKLSGLLEARTRSR